MISLPADLSYPSPWTTLITLQPKGDTKVLSYSFLPTVNSGFTLVKIREASGYLALPLLIRVDKSCML